MDSRQKEIDSLKDYKYGFSTDIENIKAPKGLNEDVIKFISNIKKEPQWMLDFRLKAFERFKQLKEPDWQKPKYPKIDYQDLYYYSAPKSMKDKPKSLDDLDPKLLETYKKIRNSSSRASKIKWYCCGCSFRLCFCCNNFQRRTYQARNYILLDV